MEQRICLERAQQLILERIPLPVAEEFVPLDRALGRVLARDFYAPLDNPPFDRSPLDGYAVRACDVAGASALNPVTLAVIDVVYAGGVPRQALAPGTASRIMTGAMLPQGATGVVPHEVTDNGLARVQVYRATGEFQNYVRRGEDVAAGTLLIPRGRRLASAELGVLACMGQECAGVFSAPAVAFFAVGDELAPGGRSLPLGQIYDSNSRLLLARLAELGHAATSRGTLRDDPDAVLEQLFSAAAQADLIITAGGVSVGDKDIFHAVSQAPRATRVFWRVAIKPGSPALFWTLAGTPVISLSGNPFAAAATFELLARPALLRLGGAAPELPRQRATLACGFGKGGAVRRFVRGTLANGAVTLPRGHSSGMLASLMGCNCLVDIPAGAGPLAAGSPVDVVLL